MNEDFEALISVPPGGVDTHETTRSRIIQDINALRGSNDFRSFTPEQQQKALTLLYDNNISTYLTQMGYDKSRIQGAKQSYFNYLLGPQAPKQAEIIGTPEYEKKKNIQPYIEQTIYGGQSPEVPQERAPLPEEQPPTSGGSWTSLLSDQLLSGLKNAQPSVAQQPQTPGSPIEQAAQPFLQEAQQEAAESITAVPVLSEGQQERLYMEGLEQAKSPIEYKDIGLTRFGAGSQLAANFPKPQEKPRFTPQETELLSKLTPEQQQEYMRRKTESEGMKVIPPSRADIQQMWGPEVAEVKEYVAPEEQPPLPYLGAQAQETVSKIKEYYNNLSPSERDKVFENINQYGLKEKQAVLMGELQKLRMAEEQARTKKTMQEFSSLGGLLPDVVTEYATLPLTAASMSFSKGVAGMTGESVRGAGALGSYLYQTIAEPSKEGYTPADNLIYNLGSELSNAVAATPQYQFNNPLANIAINELPQAAGSMIAMMAPSMIAAKGLQAAGLGARMSAPIMEYTMSGLSGLTGGMAAAGSTYSEAIEAAKRGDKNPDTGLPVTPRDAYMAMLTSMGTNTALESLGVAPIFKGLTKVKGADYMADALQKNYDNFLGRVQRYGLEAGMGEGLTEAGQSVLSDMTAREFYDFSRDIDVQRAIKEGGIGFILGAGMRGAMPQGKTLEEQVLIQKTNEGLLDKGIQEGAITPEAADMIRQTANEQALRLDKKPPFQEPKVQEEVAQEQEDIQNSQPIVTNETEIKDTPEVMEVASQPVNPNMISRLERSVNEPTPLDISESSVSETENLPKRLEEIEGMLDDMLYENETQIAPKNTRIDPKNISQAAAINPEGVRKVAKAVLDIPVVSYPAYLQRKKFRPIRLRAEDKIAKSIRAGLEVQNDGIKEVSNITQSLYPGGSSFQAFTSPESAKIAGRAVLKGLKKTGLFGGIERTTSETKAQQEFLGKYTGGFTKADRFAKAARKLVLNDTAALARVTASIDPEFAMLNPSMVSPEYNNLTELQKEQFDIARPIVQRFNLLSPESRVLYAKAKKDASIYEKLTDEQKKEYNTVIAPYERLSDEQIEIYETVRASMPSEKNLSEPEAKLRKLLKFYNDYIHEENYRMGFISPEVYNKNKGKYSARMYEEYELDELLDNNDSIDLIPEEEFTNRYGTSKGNFKKILLGKDGLQMRQELANISKTALMDPTYATAKRLQQVYENQAILEYGDKLQREGLVSDDPKPGWVKLDSPSMYQKYGPISNKYVPQWVHEDFIGYYYMNKMANDFYNMLKKIDRWGYVRFMKKYYTVFDPTVSVGNFASSWPFAFVNGVSPVQFTKNIPEARNILKYNTDGKSIVGTVISGIERIKKIAPPDKATRDRYKKIYDYLSDRNLMNVGIATELKPSSIKSKNKKEQDLLDRMRDKYGTIDKSLIEMYQASDDISKISAFLSHVENIKKFEPNSSEEQIWEQAADAVSDGFQNYTKVGKAFDWWSKLPVFGNRFAKFNGDLLRIIKNTATTTPLSGAAYLALMSMASRGLAELGKEEEEKRKFREQRPFIPKIRLPKAVGGDISLEWKTPIGYVKVNRFLSPYYDYDKGESEDALGSITKRFTPIGVHYKDGKFGVDRADFFVGPLIDFFLDEDFRSKSIQDPTKNRFVTKGVATDAERAQNVINHLFRSYLPFYQTAHDYYLLASKGEDYFGRKYTIGQMLMKKAGFPISPYDHDREGYEAFDRQLKNYDFQMKEIKTRITMAEKNLSKEIQKIKQDEDASEATKKRREDDAIEKFDQRLISLKAEYAEVANKDYEYQKKYGHLFEKNK